MKNKYTNNSIKHLILTKIKYNYSIDVKTIKNNNKSIY